MSQLILLITTNRNNWLLKRHPSVNDTSTLLVTRLIYCTQQLVVLTIGPKLKQVSNTATPLNCPIVEDMDSFCLLRLSLRLLKIFSRLSKSCLTMCLKRTNPSPFTMLLKKKKYNVFICLLNLSWVTYT